MSGPITHDARWLFPAGIFVSIPMFSQGPFGHLQILPNLLKRRFVQLSLCRRNRARERIHGEPAEVAFGHLPFLAEPISQQSEVTFTAHGSSPRQLKRCPIEPGTPLFAVQFYAANRKKYRRLLIIVMNLVHKYKCFIGNVLRKSSDHYC
jgi:hypothetical protein